MKKGNNYPEPELSNITIGDLLNAETAQVNGHYIPDDEEADEEEVKPEPARKVRATKVIKAQPKEVIDEKESESSSDSESDSSDDQSAPGEGSADGDKFMHALTCQTCAKTFEHNNPRLRDCLDCYRAKRKERRRGGGEKRASRRPSGPGIAIAGI